MEFLVDENLNELIRTNPNYFDICKCEKCMDDIKAKALNNLPPLYYTTKTGEAHSEFFSFDFQNKADIIAEIAKAVYIIQNNKHNKVV